LSRDLVAEADRRQAAGDLVTALDLYNYALYNDPQNWVALGNRGVALQLVGLSVQARSSLRSALAIEPDAARVLLNLTDSLISAGEFLPAMVTAGRAVAADPAMVEAWESLGGAAASVANRSLARHAFRRALACAPASSLSLASLAALESSSTVALLWLQRLLAVDSSTESVHGQVVHHCLASSQPGRARRHGRRRLALAPNMSAGLLNLGVAFEGVASPTEIARWYRRAIDVDARQPEAFNNLGNVLKDHGDLLAALAAYDAAITLRPDFAEAHYNRAHSLFLLGRQQEAWPEYEWRWRTRRFPKAPTSAPRWTGQPFRDARLLVFAEQGLGDTIHFFRYIPSVVALGGRVILRVGRPLLTLLRQAAADVDVVPDDESVPSHDLAVPLMSLPGIFAERLGPLPNGVPYVVRPPPAKLPDDGRLKVGLVWAGSISHEHDHRRSCPLEALAPILDVRDTAFYSLQWGPRESDIEHLGWSHALTTLGTTLGDFAATAPWVLACDLLITVDTAMAHLAGALGHPTWTLLAAVPDWRWALAGTTTPWYPTMRLIRQNRAGDWAELAGRVATAIAAAAAADRASALKFLSSTL
jgi:tetratricopeptide (TPR) repeat protein